MSTFAKIPYFDIFSFIRNLEAKGMPKDQAELIAEAINENKEQINLSVKDELKEREQSIKKDLTKDINLNIQELKHEFNDLRKDFNNDINSLRKDMRVLHDKLLIKLGTIMVATMTIGIAILGFLITNIKI